MVSIYCNHLLLWYPSIVTNRHHNADGIIQSLLQVTPLVIKS